MTTAVATPRPRSGRPRRQDRRGEAWLDAPGPARALALVRITACGFLLGTVAARTPAALRLTESGVGWDPVGLLRPLGEAPPTTAVALLHAVALASGLAATAGWRWRLSGPLFALSALAVTTFASSWSQLFHSDNLAVLHVLVLAPSRATDAWSLDARATRVTDTGPGVRYGFPVRLAAMVTAVTYVLAGWAKLRIGGLDWLDGETLRNLVAHDNLRKELIGAPSTPLAGPAVRQAWLFAPMAVVSVAVELAAPLGLAGRRLARGWCAAAWVFHLGVLALMTVSFWYPLTGLAFAPTLVAARALPGGGRTRA